MSQLIRWPLYVSPFFSSTNYKQMDLAFDIEDEESLLDGLVQFSTDLAEALGFQVLKEVEYEKLFT